MKVPANKCAYVKGRRFVEGEELPAGIVLRNLEMTKKEAEKFFDRNDKTRKVKK